MKMTPEIREKRAQAIAALNNVSWDEAKKIYRVNPPGVRNGGMFYIVRKDDTGKVQCDCEEFLTLKSDQPDFRCEHILAAKYWAETNRKREAPAPTIPHNHQGYVSSVRTPPVRMPKSPLAKSLADLITPKQIGMIRSLCRNLELDPDAECEEWTAAEFDSACKVDELSKRAASWFIEHLRDLVKADADGNAPPKRDRNWMMKEIGELIKWLENRGEKTLIPKPLAEMTDEELRNFGKQLRERFDKHLPIF